MKKGLVAAALAAPLAIIPGTALATTSGGYGGGSSVSIQQYADWDTDGLSLDVGLYVRCSGTGGLGSVEVTVTQQQGAVNAIGTGPQNVTCDGKTRLVNVTIFDTKYNAGYAKAKANVYTPSNLVTPSATATRIITLVAV
jgi:hypothetical protein